MPESLSPAAPADPADPAVGRLRALDGLRGLAVLLVLLDHASDQELRIFPGADMNRAGKYGVYLFFVLSAFLLTHLILLRPAHELVRARTWLNYAARRFLRIFPLYALVLGVLVIIHKLKPFDLATHLLLLDGKKQFWTIPVEVKFYFILPFVALAIRWLGAREWLRGGLAAAGAIVVGAAIFLGEEAWSYSTGVHLAVNLEPFLLGTAAALAHRLLLRREDAAGRSTVSARWFELAAVLALVATLVRLPSVYNQLFFFLEPVHKFAHDSLVCGLLWTAVLLGLLHGTGHLRRALEWAPLRYLGLISYSAYLWHVKFVTDVDDMPIPLPLRLLVFLLLVAAVASVSYYLIERPLSRLRFRRTGPPELVAGAASLPVG
jgi:peptidoglycan/LPS O-acetylase OafA/YrhL